MATDIIFKINKAQVSYPFVLNQVTSPMFVTAVTDDGSAVAFTLKPTSISSGSMGPQYSVTGPNTCTIALPTKGHNVVQMDATLVATSGGISRSLRIVSE